METSQLWGTERHSYLYSWEDYDFQSQLLMLLRPACPFRCTHIPQHSHASPLALCWARASLKPSSYGDSILKSWCLIKKLTTGVMQHVVCGLGQDDTGGGGNRRSHWGSQTRQPAQWQGPRAQRESWRGGQSCPHSLAPQEKNKASLEELFAYMVPEPSMPSSLGFKGKTFLLGF